jgi:NADH-quinone oxidoreductase subunit G
MVVTLSPFKSNMALSDVLLPIAPFTETSGTFVNAEGRVQSFHAVVKPLAETRPAWKVLRVLANMLDVPGFDFDSSQDVLKNISGLSWSEDAHVSSGLLNNKTQEMIDVTPVSVSPVVASIYTLDAIVRRAQSLQQTADGKRSTATKEVAA